ncbi:MAG: Gfo/Idh/MocA family oxidoreductase [Verrucomicrobiae bacterium]|nr:Gfo/Idh/MocA family oxidoreductase [Verrucomicrobiae bacterium]
MIGMDTSHVPAFTKLFHDPAAAGDLSGFRVVAGLPDGSDTPMSRDRIEAFTKETRELGVEIVDSVEALVERSDRLMILSVDGRIHLRQAKALFAAGKPVFVDKPVAGTLAECLALYGLAADLGIPCFSASSTRFGPRIVDPAWRSEAGRVLGATSWGPLAYQAGQPELFFYGIHGIEALFTAMGPGCRSVTRVKTPFHDLVTGKWSDGRVGVYRGLLQGEKPYGLAIHGEQSTVNLAEEPSYEALCLEIGRFFKTGVPPVSAAETLEIYAFMEAADESLRRGGASVELAEVMAKAAG